MFPGDLQPLGTPIRPGSAHLVEGKKSYKRIRRSALIAKCMVKVARFSTPSVGGTVWW